MSALVIMPTHYLVALILGLFVFFESRSQCHLRHALLLGALPPLSALLAELGGRSPLDTRWLIVLGPAELDLMTCAAAALGLVSARRLLRFFAKRYSDYWERLERAIASCSCAAGCPTCRP